jgi:MFS family permease
MRSIIRDRRVRWMLTSDAVSGTGDVLYWVALIVLLLDRQPNGALVAAAAAARLVPRVAFSALGGVVADRFERRTLLIALDAVRGLLMFALALIAATHGPVAGVLAIVFATCALNTPYRPAVSAAYPQLVSETDLAAVNALSNGLAQITTLTGPLLGALILAVASPTWAFLVNGATYGLSVMLVAGVHGLGRARPRGAAHHRGVLGELADGARSIGASRGVGALMLLTAAVMLLRGFELVLHVQVAADRLDLGPSGYGLISGALGFGAIAAMPFVGRVTAAARPGAVLIASALLGCATLGLLSLITRPWLAMVILAFEGASVVYFEVMALTLLQRVCHNEMLGRILGLQNTVSGGAKLAGSVAAPWLVVSFGLQHALVAAAIVVALPSLLLAPRLRSINDASAARVTQIAPRVSRLESLAVFDGMSRPALERLAMRVVQEAVDPETVVVREGEPAADFFVVVTGVMRVESAGARVNTLRDGGWFGEIGLLRGALRSASVIAETESVLWRISGAAFLEAVSSSSVTPDALSDDALNALLARTADSPERGQATMR